MASVERKSLFNETTVFINIKWMHLKAISIEWCKSAELIVVPTAVLYRSNPIVCFRQHFWNSTSPPTNIYHQKYLWYPRVHAYISKLIIVFSIWSVVCFAVRLHDYWLARSDHRKMEEHKPKEQRPKASENKPVMNEWTSPEAAFISPVANLNVHLHCLD